MAKDSAKAAEVLQVLLGLDSDGATAASSHFDGQMAAQGQAFMMKAMSLRTAVTSGTDDDIGSLLGELFGLTGDAATSATTALRTRYPAS